MDTKDRVRVRGYNLVNGSSEINATAFNVTITNVAGTGAPMLNNTLKQIPSASITHGSGANIMLYNWVKVPNVLPPLHYTSISNWVVGSY